jgi:hypothetical protein
MAGNAMNTAPSANSVEELYALAERSWARVEHAEHRQTSLYAMAMAPQPDGVAVLGVHVGCEECDADGRDDGDTDTPHHSTPSVP